MKKLNIELPPASAARPDEPNLQAPSDTSMGIAWTVNVLANGWVEYADNPEFANAKKTVCGGFGVTGFDDRVLQVRLTDLRPNTRYWYRIAAQHIDYVGNYKRFPLDVAKGAIHTFTTLGAKVPSHFCVMNDTHAQWKSFAPVVEKIAALKPSVTVWNGDASNATEKPETGIEIFLAPPIPRPGYAAELPVLWNNGNHDFRGIWSRHFDYFVMPRLPSERSARGSGSTRARTSPTAIRSSRDSSAASRTAWRRRSGLWTSSSVRRSRMRRTSWRPATSRSSTRVPTNTRAA